MRHEVIIRFGPTEELTLHCADPLPAEAARAWLDAEFVRLECVPQRASGKLLLSDKVLAVADGAGPAAFADADWAARFARAAIGLVGRSPLRVNLETQSLG